MARKSGRIKSFLVVSSLYLPTLFSLLEIDQEVIGSAFSHLLFSIMYSLSAYLVNTTNFPATLLRHPAYAPPTLRLKHYVGRVCIGRFRNNYSKCVKCTR